MSQDYLNRLDGAFWLTLSGGLFGVLGLCVRAILRSNCKEFSCCFGVIKCVRDKEKVDGDYEKDMRLRQTEMGLDRPQLTHCNTSSPKLESQSSNGTSLTL